MSKKSRTRGGFLDGLSNSASSLWTSTKNATTDAVNQTSSGASSLWNSATKKDDKNNGSTFNPSAPTQPSSMSAPSTMPGGRRRRRHRRGGSNNYYAHSTNIAATAAPFNVKTAQPQVFVGGRTRKRRRSICRSKHRKGSKCRRTHRRRGKK
uniref:Uncharacterized protein n=1 Tax=viral metagenome TaxID=1070528 RepID=A0A6C0LJB5_9ZZZZ